MKFSSAWPLMLAGFMAGCCCPEQEVVVDDYPYRQPLNSPGGKLSTLPPAVQHAIRAQAGMAQMRDIERIEIPQGTGYRVTFVKNEIYPPLYLKADGSVLYPDFNIAVGATGDPFDTVIAGPIAGIKFSDLPKYVAETVQQERPSAEVDHITRMTRSGIAVFEIQFKDRIRHPTLFVREDGAVVDAVSLERAIRYQR